MDVRTFQPTTKSGALNYRFLAPAPLEPGTRYPLLLCLHGSGERGSDNTAQVGHFRPLFSGGNRARFPCFVVIPQVPANQLWATYGWGTTSERMAAEPSVSMALTRALVTELLAREPIDPGRVYVIGLSMGGYGTWEFVQRWPELVAAAVPVCGGGDVTQAAKVAALPIWAFHGDQDTVVLPAASQAMIAAIKSAGGTPRFTLYPGVGHDSWGPAFKEAELLPWLFSRQRK